MEDSLEKITINIDSYNASFIDEYEFYVDIIDDIKNCIYIKTLKTEVFTDTEKNTENSEFISHNNDEMDHKTINKFRSGEYIYLTLNDIHRINTVSKEVVPFKFSDLNSGEEGYTEFSKSGNPQTSPSHDASSDFKDVVYKDVNGAQENPDGTITNYKIKDTYYNTLRYFDNIYINYEDNSDGSGVKVYKQELTGTSCGPNDTNTKVLNPILPELRRFNIILWRVDQYGKHVKVPIGPNQHVFRVIMSFTIYYKRKKITRV